MRYNRQYPRTEVPHQVRQPDNISVVMSTREVHRALPDPQCAAFISIASLGCGEFSACRHTLQYHTQSAMLAVLCRSEYKFRHAGSDATWLTQLKPSQPPQAARPTAGLSACNPHWRPEMPRPPQRQWKLQCVRRLRPPRRVHAAALGALPILVGERRDGRCVRLHPASAGLEVNSSSADDVC